MVREELARLLTWSERLFSTVQILTVSSSASNPLTHAGKLVDVALELWAIFVVTAVAGSFASFFASGDRS